GLAVKLRLASHKNMVSGVRWSSTSSYALASCSYDGTLKFWDMRSSTPLYTVRAVEPPATGGPLPPKLLAVDWDVEHGVVLAGGEEGKLRVFAVNE
ncbi:ribosome biogenesis protein ytm1, partial [Cladochytrium tenue]